MPWPDTSDDVRFSITYGFDWHAPVIGELILNRQALERHVRQATKDWDPDTQHWSALARGGLGPSMSDALRREIERPKFDAMSDDEFLSQAAGTPDGLRLLSQETFLYRLQRWLAADDKVNLLRLKKVFRRHAGRRSKTSKQRVQESYRSTLPEIGRVHALLRKQRNAASAVLLVQAKYPVLYSRIVKAGLKETWFPVTASQNEHIVRREHMAAELVGLEQDLKPSTVLKYAQVRPKESTRN
jgi:hypothetical protein